MNKEQYRILYELRCKRGKHKFRENKFGVTFCVICGLLSNGNAEKLKEEDKIKIA